MKLKEILDSTDPNDVWEVIVSDDLLFLIDKEYDKWFKISDGFSIPPQMFNSELFHEAKDTINSLVPIVEKIFVTPKWQNKLIDLKNYLNSY
jgi:hypothetical protein